MGAGNVALAFGNWAALDDRSFRVLCRMALVSMDNGNPPRYFAGRDDLAAALGKTVPAKPDDLDQSEVAEAARKARASVYEVVRKAVARLVREGVIVSSGDARFRNRAEYSLYLKRTEQTQQIVAPDTTEGPGLTQQIVAPLPQQSVAPMTQRSVATDPTDRCPLGVEEPLQEQLIGVSPAAQQGEIEIELPTEDDPRLSKAALAKQFTEDFNDWYAIYPKHVARGAAVNAYNKARKNGATPEQLLAGAKRYAGERKGQDPQYTAAPTTWLNQERWTDDPDHTGEIDVDAVLGKDYWTPGTPPEGLDFAAEIAWKKDQRAAHNAERLAEAKAKQAASGWKLGLDQPPLGPWDAAYHQQDKLAQKMHNTFAAGQRLQAQMVVPRQYQWCNTPEEIEATEQESA